MLVYGIANCDSVRRARAWLGARGVDHEFHDFKKAGVPAAALESWVAALGWQPLVHRQGSTWRKLDAAAQQALVDARSTPPDTATDKPVTPHPCGARAHQQEAGTPTRDPGAA